MKKIIVIIFVMAAGISVFAQSSDNSSGVIRDFSGTVELKPAGESKYVPAKTGDEVRQNTVISTGFKSTALVELGSAVITVRPLTRLTLTEISASAGSETLNVNLQAGRVRVDVNPPAGTRAAMTVISPSATASVRGTSFEFDTRNLYVNNGIVSFAGKKGSPMMVKGGASSLVGANNKAVNPNALKNASFMPAKPQGSDPASGVGGGTGGAGGIQISQDGTFTVDIYYPEQSQVQ